MDLNTIFEKEKSHKAEGSFQVFNIDTMSLSRIKRTGKRKFGTHKEKKKQSSGTSSYKQ